MALGKVLRSLAGVGLSWPYAVAGTGSWQRDCGEREAQADREVRVEHLEWSWSVWVGELRWSRARWAGDDGSGSCSC